MPDENICKNPQLNIKKPNSIIYKLIIHNDQWDLFQGCKHGSIPANQHDTPYLKTKEKNDAQSH